MPNQTIDELSKIFKLLANKQRLTILTLLRQHSYTVGELMGELGMEQSAVSHQLKALRDAQVVTTRREGRQVFYTLNDSHILTLLDNAQHHVEHVLKHQTHQEAMADEHRRQHDQEQHR
ncbi:metalloregulator ArsR/SmtB family transcription factor [Leuconostocaceae bacterium ESL0723]|nr:metalloregulator ArsR/SmtB family transcription factor [Leuconostocaceae bacterium ESL0723]